MRTSRRDFVLGSASSLIAGASLRAQAARTAQQVVDRLREDLGAPPSGNTVDGFKAGDPSTPISGVVTATMATIDVLRAAGERRLVISHEPVFYTANDDPGPRASDQVYLAKKTLIEDRRLVVYRLFDLWNAHRTRAFTSAIASQLRGTPVGEPGQLYDVPPTTLGALAAARRAGGVRVVGDRAMPVRRVCISAGSTTLAATMAGLLRADVVIAGEPREWEAVPYVLDSIAAGQRKGMLLFGRLASEPSSAMADWVKHVIPDLPVTSDGDADPYWRP